MKFVISSKHMTSPMSEIQNENNNYLQTLDASRHQFQAGTPEIPVISRLASEPPSFKKERKNTRGIRKECRAFKCYEVLAE